VTAAETGLYVPTRVGNNGGSVNKDNNKGIDKPSINISNVSTVNISVNNNNNGIDKSNTNKSSNTQGKAGTNSIDAKRAKFEEDVKKEPILQTILDVFDGELLS
jgi:hypothetical protein